MQLFRTVLSYAAFEVRRTLRDPQVVVFIGFPVVLYPTVMWGMVEFGQLEKGRTDQEIYKVATIDPELQQAFEAHERLLLTEGDQAALEAGVIDAWVQRDGPSFQVHQMPSRPRSKRGAKKVSAAVEEAHRERLRALLTEEDGDLAALDAFDVEVEFASPMADLGAWMMSFMLGMIGPLSMLLSGIYPTIDLFVVERERDTLDTLLVSSAPRQAMVLGKLLACVAIMLMASFANMGALGLAAAHAAAMVFEDGPPITLPGLPVLLMATATLVTNALVCATFLMAALVPTRTYKEGEWFTTVLLMGSFPLMGLALVSMLAGEPPGWLWFVPFTHTILAIASSTSGDLTLVRTLTVIGVDLAFVGGLLAILWRTPGPQGLIAGAWRPPWLDRMMGSS